ncbi:SulP family inorganic anion transporter [Flexithrix dorotheae]|uniref:SulP family inorganic anion transporter n=1 Tax=Flexithrix dorotheae TaxID=70993 RepID=UPI00036F05FE|nr:solute carrier family 26 protein [Flexithrix dorotheae]
MRIKKYIPILEWLPGYKKQDLPGDISAGLTVGVMLIPQGMAYAIVAGLPPVYGLYAALFPQLIYAILGTSGQLAIGAVAMDSLLVAAGVSAFAVAGTAEYIELAILLAGLIGLIQFLFGVFRLGFLVNFLSKPVISGFTFAAAFIIGLNQLGNITGIKLARDSYLHHILIDFYLSIQLIHFPTLLLGISAILLIKILGWWNKDIPASLMVVILSILVVSFFDFDQQGVQIVGSIPKGLPDFSFPNFSFHNVTELLPTAFGLALIGFMEATAIGKAMATNKNKVRANQELIALGSANFIGSLFQSFPVSSGFARTAVNIQAGAKTSVAALFSASLIALTLFVLTPYFYYLPKAILAAIIMVAVVGLIDVGYIKNLWRTDKRDFILMLITFISTLGFGIQEGIVLGIFLSLGLVIYHSVYPHMASLGKIEGTNFYRNVQRFPKARQPEEMLIIRFDAQLYFANINYFKDKIEELVKEKGDKLKVIILNADAINSIDTTAFQELHQMVINYQKAGIDFYFSGVIGPVRDTFFQNNLIDEFGREKFFMDVEEAVKFFEKHKAKEQNTIDENAIQTNVGNGKDI